MENNLYQIPIEGFNAKSIKSGENFYRGFIIRGDHSVGVKSKYWVHDKRGCNPMPGACHFTSLAKAFDGIDVLLFTLGNTEHFWEIMQPFTGYEVGKLAPGTKPNNMTLGGSISCGRFFATWDEDCIVTKVWISERRIWDGKPECPRPNKAD